MTEPATDWTIILHHITTNNPDTIRQALLNTLTQAGHHLVRTTTIHSYNYDQATRPRSSELAGTLTT